MRNVRIDDVIVARSDAAAAEPLPDGLAKKLYNEPIIVREDMVLIDGLRRLLWHRANGNETAPAIVVGTFLDAIEALAPQHTGRTPSGLRIWNFMSVLDFYARQWSRAKANGGWVRGPDGTFIRNMNPNPNVKNPQTSVRHQYRVTFNVNDHILQGVSYLYRLAERGDVRARAVLDRVEAGEMGYNAGVQAYKMPNNLGGHITDPQEQRQILERAVTGLGAHVTSLQKLGYPLSVPTAELTQILNGLAEERGAITSLITGIRKTLKERETNG